MPHFPNRSPVFWSLAVLLFLGGCNAQVDCDSPETRNAVLKIVSDDHANPLATYAAKNANSAKNPGSTSPDTKNPANPESANPLYRIGEKIVTTSTGKDKRTLTCSGPISVTVGDTKATKEVDFTVQRLADGQLSVSVAPFQF